MFLYAIFNSLKRNRIIFNNQRELKKKKTTTTTIIKIKLNRINPKQSFEEYKKLST